MESSDIQATSMSMKDVVKMATLLRDKGDKLLNFSCKLSLTVGFLIKLNEAFDMIVENVDTSCFQVINTNNSSVEFLHDLQFLHDFVQKISALRLWNRNRTPVSSVRLEKFRSLHYLDLYGVSVRNMKVLCLRDKLKSLSCTHCNLQDIKDLLIPEASFTPQSMEDGSVNIDHHWEFLEELLVPYNGVKYLGTSLLYVPKLKFLDLSHNFLTDLSPLSHSRGNLEWLNISYNGLKSIPVISNCAKLKVLLINDNQLADVAGLDKMPSLQEIDLSNNLLRDHSSLMSISNLTRIEILRLQGNPIAFKRGHRLLTIDHLHPLVLFSGKLYLDGQLLSSIEQSHFYSRDCYGSTKGLNSESKDSHLTYSSPCNPQGPSTSRHQKVPMGRESSHSHSLKAVVASGSRPVKIREVAIADEEDYASDGFKETNQESEFTQANAMHLETKRNIETLRKNAGEENWLHGGGGQKMLNILGLPMRSSVAPALLDLPSTPPTVVEPSPDQVAQQSDGSIEPSCDRAEEVRVEGEDEGVLSSSNENNVAQGGEEEEEEEESGVASCSQESERKEFGAELGVFVVQRGRVGHSLPGDDLLLRVTERLLTECNVTNGMETARRTLTNLVAVSEKRDGDHTSIRLTFRDNYHMEELSYFMEEDESLELLKLIKDLLELKYLNSAEKAIQFTCIKCSTTFDHSSSSNDPRSFKIGIEENNLGKDSISSPNCPKCGSAAVIQNVEEATNFQEHSGVPLLQVVSNPSSENVTFQHSEHKDPIIQWAENNTIEKACTSSEAVSQGLHLHVLLNILPEDHGKEFDVQDVLIFQANTGDAFSGHIVISAENVYVLKEENSPESEDRRLSTGEHSAPILMEEHPTEHCLSVLRVHSGYQIKFGPEHSSSLWVFPCYQKQLEKAMEGLQSMLKNKQFHLDEKQRINENTRLSEAIMLVPAAAVTCITGVCGLLESSVDDAQFGILVLTSSLIYFINHGDIQAYVYNSEFTLTNERRIADIVSVSPATSTFHQLHGIILHFSSEEHDDKYLVWPWGEGALVDLLHSLQRPWEDIFSVPFETILAQAGAEET